MVASHLLKFCFSVWERLSTNSKLPVGEVPLIPFYCFTISLYLDVETDLQKPTSTKGNQCGDYGHTEDVPKPKGILKAASYE